MSDVVGVFGSGSSGGFLTIDRLGHLTGHGERSGGLSTAKSQVFSARIFVGSSRNTQKHIGLLAYGWVSGGWIDEEEIPPC